MSRSKIGQRDWAEALFRIKGLESENTQLKDDLENEKVEASHLFVSFTQENNAHKRLEAENTKLKEQIKTLRELREFDQTELAKLREVRGAAKVILRLNSIENQDNLRAALAATEEQEPIMVNLTYRDEEHVLSGTIQAQLEHALIILNSETVKTVESRGPLNIGAIILPTRLPNKNIVPNTAVVTADRALNTVYVEGMDYVLDYDLGKINRVTGSAIPEGGKVFVWYFYYMVHVRGTDYQMDYVAGKVSRIDSGAINDDSTVYVDYTALAATEESEPQ